MQTVRGAAVAAKMLPTQRGKARPGVALSQQDARPGVALPQQDARPGVALPQ